MAKINSIRSSRHQLFALRRRQLKLKQSANEWDIATECIDFKKQPTLLPLHSIILFYFNILRGGELECWINFKKKKNECSRASQENDESQHRCAMITRIRTQPIFYIQLRYLLVITTHRKGNSKRQHHLNNTRSRRIIVIQNDWQGRVELDLTMCLSLFVYMPCAGLVLIIIKWRKKKYKNPRTFCLCLFTSSSIFV